MRWTWGDYWPRSYELSSHCQQKASTAPVIWWVPLGIPQFLASPSGRWKNSFFLAERREHPHPQETVPPPNRQVGKELACISCSSPETILSNLLRDILMEEEPILSSMGCYKFQGAPSYIRVHTTWMPSIWVFLQNLLTIWCWFQIFQIGSFIQVKSCGICVPTDHSNYPPKSLETTPRQNI